MSAFEPSDIEITSTLLAGRLLGWWVYKPYIQGLELKGNERVLDFGSGSGVTSRYLAQRLLPGGGHLTCVDISRRWSEVAQQTLKGLPNVDFQQGELSALGIPNSSYDAVFVQFVLHDVPAAERARILHHLASTLRSEGRFFIKEPTTHGMALDELRALLGMHGLRETGGRIMSVPTMGPTFEGVFVKTA